MIKLHYRAVISHFRETAMNRLLLFNFFSFPFSFSHRKNSCILIRQRNHVDICGRCNVCVTKVIFIHFQFSSHFSWHSFHVFRLEKIVLK